MRVILLVILFLHCFVNKGFSWSIQPLNNKGLNLKFRINLVFCPLNYLNKEDFSRDVEIVLERLKHTRPFDEVTDVFGVWQVNMTQDEEKGFFKEMQDFPPLKVRQDFLNDISTHLKANYKLIIMDATGVISCAELSSASSLSLIILGKARYKNQNSFNKGFLHELGHSLGLRDECVDCGELCPPGPPNCAMTQEEARIWWGDLVGKVERVRYIQGCCGNKNYIRPVIASLMNDPEKAEDFGPVNERFLKEELSRE